MGAQQRHRGDIVTAYTCRLREVTYMYRISYQMSALTALTALAPRITHHTHGQIGITRHAYMTSHTIAQSVCSAVPLFHVPLSYFHLHIHIMVVPCVLVLVSCVLFLFNA